MTAAPSDGADPSGFVRTAPTLSGTSRVGLSSATVTPAMAMGHRGAGLTSTRAKVIQLCPG